MQSEPIYQGEAKFVIQVSEFKYWNGEGRRVLSSQNP